MMWIQEKTTRNDVVILLNYENFATIEVLKKRRKNDVIEYEINFHIEEVTDQSVIAYKIEDVSKVLENAKVMIEDLYDDFEDYSESDIYDFLDDFIESINNF